MRLRALVATTSTALAVTTLASVPAVADPAPNRATDPAKASPACPWVGSTATPAARAAQLLSAMTTDDKIQMVHGTAGVLQPYGPTYAGQVEANPRLCIPALSPSDGPSGVGNGKTGVTQLPAPLALGATWDRDLARRYGDLIGAENVAKGSNFALGPGVDIAHDPRAGRYFEDLGEDPVLVGELGAAETAGIQGRGVLAVAKHLAAYTQETSRNTPIGDAKVDERTLNELYLSPYERLVAAGVSSVMCSYNKVNGTHACNDGYLMNQSLKGRMGFDGFVVSDWFGMHAALASANAGLDLQMPDSCYFDARLRAGLRENKVTANRLDDMVTRILTPMFARGLFDRAVTGTPDAVATNAEHADLARRVAQDSMVLLKNDGTLPLTTNATRIAVIGSAAGRDVIASGGGSAHVVADRVVTPLAGIATRAKQQGSSVSYYGGILPAKAAQTAKAADVSIVVVSSARSESKDALDASLSLVDRNLVDAARKANPHTIVVLNTGSPVDLSFRDDVAGVVASWYGGQEYGTALAALLFGDANFSGRLPVTFQPRQDRLPGADAARFPGGGHTEGLDVGYRWYDRQGTTPAYAFGSGLSYTTFRYTNLQVGAWAGDSAQVSFDVTNTGSRSGTVTPQVYTGPSAAGGPMKSLADFTKLTLEPGQTQRVTARVTARGLAHWDTARHGFVLSAGTYRVWAGDSARDLPLAGAVTVGTTRDIGAATPPSFPNQPAGNESAAESVKDALVCGNGGFMAGGVGLASYFGLVPQPQAVAKPTDEY